MPRERARVVPVSPPGRGLRGKGSDKEEPLIFRPREGDPAVPFEVNHAVFVFLTPASGSGEKLHRRGGFSSQNPAL